MTVSAWGGKMLYRRGILVKEREFKDVIPELKDMSPFFHSSSYDTLSEWLDLFEFLTLNYECGSPWEPPLGKLE